MAKRQVIGGRASAKQKAASKKGVSRTKAQAKTVNKAMRGAQAQVEKLSGIRQG